METTLTRPSASIATKAGWVKSVRYHAPMVSKIHPTAPSVNATAVTRAPAVMLNVQSMEVVMDSIASVRKDIKVSLSAPTDPAFQGSISQTQVSDFQNPN